MTVPQTRHRKLSTSELLAAPLPAAKSLNQEYLNLELCGYYPDDPDPIAQSYYRSAREKWHAPLKLATEGDLPDFTSRTRQQVRQARELIQQDYDQCVRMPWPSLHRVIEHGLLPTQLWTVAAASGHGKTTFAMNLVQGWVAAGKRVYVVPLEQPTEVMRVYLAALTLGFPTKLALANRWREMLNPTAQDAVDRELVEQENNGELLHFSDVDFLTVSGLPAVLEEARQFGADVVLIDHVHHILGEGRNRYAEFEAICQTMHRFTKDTRIPVVAMAQLHRGQMRDRVKPYLPPDIETIQNGDVLRQVSSVVMGLFRPLLDLVTKSELQRIRMGQAPIRDFLKPNTMAVSVLKSRVSGDIGETVDLTYNRGRIEDPEPETETREQYA